ncbi:hypothetical protein [Enteroccous phage Ef212]|nr:hypothetical protein [Enteroccous phage Ef212]
MTQRTNQNKNQLKKFITQLTLQLMIYHSKNKQTKPLTYVRGFVIIYI